LVVGKSLSFGEGFRERIYPLVPITLSNRYSMLSFLICGAETFAVVKIG